MHKAYIRIVPRVRRFFSYTRLSVIVLPPYLIVIHLLIYIQYKDNQLDNDQAVGKYIIRDTITNNNIKTDPNNQFTAKNIAMKEY